LTGWRPGTWLIALPVGLVLAALGMARRPDASTPSPISSVPREGRASTAVAPPSVDPRSLSRPLDPGVLELGVRRVILDAGHGGDNRGTASRSGLQEKALTLDIALRTRDLLEQRGFDIIMTRTTDASVSLQERATLANARRGDIFVSIHLNALQPASATGIETYYLGPSAGPEHDAIAAAENQQSGYSLSDMRALLERIYADARRDESRRLAEAVQDALMRRMRQVDPELTNRGVKMAPFVVLVATEMPAILAEVACLSNAEEADRLRTPGHRQLLAEALASGIQAFASKPGGSPRAERPGASDVGVEDETRSTVRERTGSSGS
jgi:N-acetylmuramoyl-L-alanine amidase